MSLRDDFASAEPLPDVLTAKRDRGPHYPPNVCLNNVPKNLPPKTILTQVLFPLHRGFFTLRPDQNLPTRRQPAARRAEEHHPGYFAFQGLVFRPRWRPRDLSRDDAVITYEEELQRAYGSAALIPGRPLFDVCLLGLGEDGHTGPRSQRPRFRRRRPALSPRDKRQARTGEPASRAHIPSQPR